MDNHRYSDSAGRSMLPTDPSFSPLDPHDQHSHYENGTNGSEATLHKYELLQVEDGPHSTREGRPFGVAGCWPRSIKSIQSIAIAVLQACAKSSAPLFLPMANLADFILPLVSRLCQNNKFRTLVAQIFALLWLAPVSALIALNKQQYIIGASANCLPILGGCLPAVYTNITSMNAATRPIVLNKRSHDLLGGLQLISKILEIWFVLIASWLVYMLTISLASRQGLPLGYLSKPTDFANLPTLFTRALWSGIRRLPSAKPKPRRVRGCIYLFIAATIVLCGLCNLIGPAIAVLLLPNLQWVDAKTYIYARFANMESHIAPFYEKPKVFGPDCSTANLTKRQYSCSDPMSLDGLVDGYLATQDIDLTTTVQDRLTFSYNCTMMWTGYPAPNTTNNNLDIITWIPSRQALEGLSDDQRLLQRISLGYSLESFEAKYGTLETWQQDRFLNFYQYNNTVQTILRRTGPIVGALANVWAGNRDEKQWTVNITEAKRVKCYKAYDVANIPLCWQGHDCKLHNTGTYTRCIQVGQGWPGYETAQFHIHGGKYGPNVTFKVHSSPKAAFFLNDQLPYALRDTEFATDCFQPPNSIAKENCDWETFFRTEHLEQRSRNPTTWEIVAEPHTYRSTDRPRVSLVIDFVAYQTFANYTTDPNKYTNSLRTTNFQIRDFSTITMAKLTALRINPDWALLAWSVDADGTLQPYRAATIKLLNVLNELQKYSTTPAQLDTARAYIAGSGLMPILQMLSILSHNNTNNNLTATSDRPLLQQQGNIQVYAYGFFSRSSYMGLSVVSMGIAVVIFQFFFGFAFRLKYGRRFRSQTQLLAAALEHSYGNEFENLEERHLDRVGFKLQEDENITGKFRFEKVEHL